MTTESNNDVSNAEDGSGEKRSLVNKSTGQPAWVKTCRFQLSILAFLCTLSLYLMRSSMSVAIVCMTYDPNSNLTVLLSQKSNLPRTGVPSTTNIHIALEGANLSESVAPPLRSFNRTSHRVGSDASNDCPPILDEAVFLLDLNSSDVFPWSRTTRGWVLSAYYIGYVITQIPAGWIATSYGTKWPLFISMSISSVLTLLTPTVARINVYLLMGIQGLKGMVSGVHYPLFYHLIGVWAPPFERSFMVAMLFSGAPVGTVLSSVLSGYLCQHGFDGGWPSIFYTFGILNSVLTVIWVALAYDSPEDHPRISEEERDYLAQALPSTNGRGKRSVPWRALLSTGPLYAIFTANICYSWGWFVVLSSLPQYMKDVLRFNIKQNGLFNAIPYVVNWVLSLTGSFIADAIAKRDLMSKTCLRKIFESLGLLPSAGLAVGVAFLSSCHQRALAVVLLSLWVGCLGFTRSGADCTQMELAPAFAGLIMGIDQTLTALTAITAPVIVAALTIQGTQEEWCMVFFITSAVFLFGWFVFVAFSSAEEQEWAKGETPPDNLYPTWALVASSAGAMGVTPVKDAPWSSFSIRTSMAMMVRFLCQFGRPYR